MIKEKRFKLARDEMVHIDKRRILKNKKEAEERF